MDVLGFTVLYQMDEMGWCKPSTPVARVNMGLWQVEKPEGKDGATLTLGVTDIDAAREELEGKGVRFDGPTQTIESING